jgi:hypothetical protein
MSDGAVHLHTEAGVASVLFDRPQARNAMTWAMYEQLMAICRQLQPLHRSRPSAQGRKAARTAWPTSRRSMPAWTC